MTNPPDDGRDAQRFATSQIYAELHAIAEREFRGQRANHTLQATALVHEAWMRLADREPDSFADRSHFLAAAAKVMRHVLVDHARRVRAAKRGGAAQRVTLLSSDGVDPSSATSGTDVLDLDAALTRLEAQDERLARVVELRFFAGLPIPEVAEALSVSHMTVSSDWRRARVWLARELSP